MNGPAYRARSNKAETNTDNYRSLLDTAYSHITPDRNMFNSDEEGHNKSADVYDETAVLACPQSANRLQAAMIPDWRRWVEFVAGDDVPEGDRIAFNAALENATKALYTYHNASNFSTEANPAFIDCLISTGVIGIEERKLGEPGIAPFQFFNIPLPDCRFEKVSAGALVNLWYDRDIIRSDIETMFPNATIPDKLAKLIKDAPNEPERLTFGQVKKPGAAGKPAKFCFPVLWNDDLLQEVEEKTQRIFAFRMNVMPGETLGRGPGILVLNAIVTANIYKRLHLENSEIQAAGMYTHSNSGVFNPHTFRVEPGATIPVDSNANMNPTLRKLETGGDLSLSVMSLDELQATIKRAFFVDPLGSVDDPTKTLGEQMMRMQEFIKDQGTSIVRLRTELLDPLIDAEIEILKERGLFPAEDLKVDGKTVKLNHISPLAQAQMLEDYNAIQTWLASASVYPQEYQAMVGMVAKLDMVFQRQGENLGVPQDLLQDPEEQKQMVQTAMTAITEGGNVPTGPPE